MKLVSALAVVALVAFPSADKLVFGVKEGTKLSRTFEQSLQMHKRSMSVSIAGQEVPAEALEESVFESSFEETIEVEDDFEKVDDERPLVLVRKYAKLKHVSEDKVRMLGMPEAQESKEDKESALDGTTVRFRWDDEKDEHAKEWVGDGADDELLEELEEDMDLRAILPSKAVSEGDTWTIDLKEHAEVLGPGGDFAFKSADDDEDDDDDGFEENLKGELTCTFKGIADIGGKKLARIAAIGKASTFDDQEQDEGGTMHIEFAMDLEGEFLWDPTAKRLASYELTGAVTAKLTIEQELGEGDQTAKLEMKIDLEGEMKVEGKVEER